MRPLRSKPSVSLLAAFALATAALLPAAALRAQSIAVTPANATGVYQAGDTASWNITVEGDVSALKGLHFSVRPGNFSTSKSGDLKLVDGKASFSASYDKPGWVLVEFKGKNAAGKEVTGYGGAVFSPDKIQPSAPRPADFDAFWKAKIAELAAVPANPVVTPAPSGVDGIDYAFVQLDNIRGTHVQGQLARPTKGNSFPALLIVQWAGIYPLDKNWVLNRAKEGWLVLNIQAHDLPAIGPKVFYDDQFKGPLHDYWARGNEDRDTSYFLRMYLGCYRAADYLAHRPDWNGRTLVVTGASQGGLQTLLTAAIYPKITAALALVPAGCDETGPDVGREGGWPQWYDHAQGKDAARVKEASRYYDIVNFAPNIHCPILVAEGLIDNVCPITGTYAAFNLIPAPKEMVVMPIGDHQHNQEAYHAREEAWLSALREDKAPPVKAD